MNDQCCQSKPISHRLLAIVGQGFEELELAPYTDLAGWTRILQGMPGVSVSIGGFHEIIRSRHGLRIVRDLSIETAAAEDWDGLVIPGGWPGSGYEELYREPVLSLIRRVHQRGGLIATSCSGVFAVGEAGLLRGRRATTYVSPGGCSSCTTNGERLASYGAVVCEGPLVMDGRILSDIGPAVGLRGALELFRHFIGDEGVLRLQRELRGGLGVSHACCSSKESQP